MNKIIPQKKENAKSIIDQYNDQYKSIDRNNPKIEQLNALSTFIKDNFNALNIFENQMNIVLNSLLNFFLKNKLDNTISMAVLNGMKDQMQFSESSIIEKMLINDIIVSWLRLQIAEWYLTNSLNKNANKVTIDAWDRMVSTSQKRYLRSTESLIRIRKSGMKFQINIATDGSKQKNLQV